MLFILYIVPVAFSADSKLVKNSVLLLSETLYIQAVTRESGKRKFGSVAHQQALGTVKLSE